MNLNKYYFLTMSTISNILPSNSELESSHNLKKYALNGKATLTTVTKKVASLVFYTITISILKICSSPFWLHRYNLLIKLNNIEKAADTFDKLCYLIIYFRRIQFSYIEKCCPHACKLEIKTFAAAATEEMICRVLFQEVILRRLPKTTMKRLGIKKADEIVDHTIVKVMRLIASAALFALLHRSQFHPLGSNGVPQFISGLFYGIILESAKTTPQLMLYTSYISLHHTAHNYILLQLSRHLLKCRI